MTTPYDEMKAWLEECNVGVPHAERHTVEGERGILAMARKNDPFYAGQAWQMEGAKWFAGLFHRLGFEGRKLHLRFFHYVAAGMEPNPQTGERVQELLPDGTPYENTKENWALLQEAAKFARNVGYVDPRGIIEKRGPRPSLHAPGEPAPEPEAVVHEPFLRFPYIEVSDLEPYFSEGYATPVGYQYTPAHEPSLAEVWVEKTLDEGDEPMIQNLCKELAVNLEVGIGYMPVGKVYALLERRAALGKPLRVLYLTDFDFAGKCMPVGPARHIEFALRNMDEKPDIRLHHLGLTEDQVEDLGLPRMAGEGDVKLNSLMHPSRVADTEKILRDAITSLRDDRLPLKLKAARGQARRILAAEVERRLRWPHRALSLLEERAREIGERYVEELQELADRLEAEMAPLEERARHVRQGARLRLRGLEDVELPLTDVGEEADGVADGWLYDSRRDYLGQLDYYKKHKNGGGAE